MGCRYLYFQPRILSCSLRRLTGKPCVISAYGYFQYTTNKRWGIQGPHLLYHLVPRCDSFAKYAAAFFKMSRSIFTSASSRFSRAISIPLSLNGFWFFPISASLPDLCALTQLPMVDGTSGIHIQNIEEQDFDRAGVQASRYSEPGYSSNRYI